MQVSFLKSSAATFFFLFILNAFNSVAQTASEELNSVHGNFQIDAQYYNEDSLIGAPKVPEKMLSNAFGNIMYNKGKFSAGIRYEAYNNVMQGFNPSYKGQGIVNRFARYQDKLLDVTVGNIYDQFGMGLMFRTYYEPGLLYDNSLDGVRVISNPRNGITLKGLVGKQRSFFTVGQGIVRGVDGEVNINELFDSALVNMKTKIIIGGSFVSKNQTDNDPKLLQPENVGCYGGRLTVINGGFNFSGEYAYKMNDPSFDNGYSYKFGEALFISSSYATKGFSFLLQGKRIDNMSFRSDRDANIQNLLINYLPATTKQHTYLMPAYYPYATQINGEIGGMAEMQFKIPKDTWLGGKYGTEITLNYSHASDLKRKPFNDSLAERFFYSTAWDQIGRNFYHDFFVDISKKINKRWKFTAMYCNQFYDKALAAQITSTKLTGNIESHIGVLDITYKYKTGSAIRLETQGLFTKQDKGDWATAMIEWTPSSHWFVAVLDQYNYGNSVEKLRLHYFLASAGYTKDAHRISISYGKQRAGVFCVGGVCRNVPASNGLAISITSTF
ncbi:MAG: DUF6029 family protein [Sediminibacterium sp.]|nr:DUF6029 family protein [Sediminibacterium sp.]